MQLMSKRCSALTLKNGMKQSLKTEQQTTGFSLQDFPKLVDVPTTNDHTPRTGATCRPKNFVAQVSEFSLAQDQQSVVSFGRVLQQIGIDSSEQSPEKCSSGFGSTKENVKSRINRKENSAGFSRLRIEKDEKQKLKIVKESPHKIRPRLARYNPTKRQVVIDVSELTAQCQYPPDRIEEIFEKAMQDLVERLKLQSRPKQFRGDSFSASVPIRARSP